MYFSREIFNLFLKDKVVQEYLTEPFKLNEDLEPWQEALVHHVKAHAEATPIRNREEALAFTTMLAQTGLPIEHNPILTEVFGPEPLQALDLCDKISLISLGLHWAHPERFLCYNAEGAFTTLQQIHALFSIPLPLLPSARDWEGRFRFYGLVNDAWQEHRAQRGFTPQEMHVFIQGFAPHFLDEEVYKQELPEPMKAWPLVAGRTGAHEIEVVTDCQPGEDLLWHSNANVRRGDVLLMYAVKGGIHSVWRATSDAFQDPFVEFFTTVYVRKVSDLPTVTFKEMQAHPILKNSSAVKTHFVGPNSGSFTRPEYNALKELLIEQGAKPEHLPDLQAFTAGDAELENERDVEVNLIEPLLTRLGYKEGDWVRQLSLRMGRGERVYPDYAIGITATPGDERARFILEAKHRIPGPTHLRDAYQQAKSYALRLQADRVALAATEGLWVVPKHRGAFALEHAKHFTWAELDNPDRLHELRKVMGRDVVLA